MAKKKAESAPANGRERPTPAYFVSLSLENVRCFGPKQTLDLSDGAGGWARWTVLLGENGTGKTTVLQAVVAMAWDSRVPAGSPPPSDLSGQPVQWYSTLAHRRLSSLFAHLPRADERAVVTAGYGPAAGSVGRSVTIDVGPNGVTVWTAPHGDAEAPVAVPPCIPYGSSRRLGSSPLQESGHPESLFREDAPLVNAEEWLVRLDYSSSKPSRLQERGKHRLRQVEELLVSLLPDVEAVRYVVEGDVMPTARVEFRTPYGWVPMRRLSSGYQTVIAWMVDLASRMVEHYPDSPDPLAEPVVVLVDEIDLHLHPKWQRSLIAKLDERFPKAQFIVTAHSPLVVQAAPNANLAVLRREGDHVVIDNDVDAIRNWRVDQILTSDLFGLPTARPPQIEKDLARRSELLQKAKLTARDQKEIDELEVRIGPLPGGETPEQRRMLELLERSTQLLEKELSPKP